MVKSSALLLCCCNMKLTSITEPCPSVLSDVNALLCISVSHVLGLNRLNVWVSVTVHGFHSLGVRS